MSYTPVHKFKEFKYVRRVQSCYVVLHVQQQHLPSDLTACVIIHKSGVHPIHEQLLPLQYNAQHGPVAVVLQQLIVEAASVQQHPTVSCLLQHFCVPQFVQQQQHSMAVHVCCVYACGICATTGVHGCRA
jgi:hypothetical protein